MALAAAEYSGEPVADEVGAKDGHDLAIFAINLDRSHARWQGIERDFGMLPWPLHRVAALDAVTQSEAVLGRRGFAVTCPPDGIGWNRLRSRPHALVEEACFVSHLDALSRFLASGHAYGLILEDDAMPVADLVELLPAVIESGAHFDIVKLEGIARRGGRPALVAARTGTRALVRSFRPSSGAAAYLLTRHAARALLDRARNRAMPFDDYLWNPGLHGLDILQVAPWAVWQHGNDTTMTHGRGPVRLRKKRDPYHFLSQALIRGGLRVALWYHVLKGARLALGTLENLPWSGDCLPFKRDEFAEAAQ